MGLTLDMGAVMLTYSCLHLFHKVLHMEPTLLLIQYRYNNNFSLLSISNCFAPADIAFLVFRKFVHNLFDFFMGVFLEIDLHYKFFNPLNL